MTKIIPVILSGGFGTRLWPLSRAAKPKQLHALFGSQTMLQATFSRVADDRIFAPPIIVANRCHADEIESQLGVLGAAGKTLILEPAGRNTAPAIALAALEAGDESILLVVPSDHVIQDVAAFQAAVEIGARAAEEGWLVTFGIRPDRAETGYGYIRRGEELAAGIFQVERFIEKPDRATAKRYLAEGCYDWNGGIFLFKAGRFLAELGTHAADILGATRASMAQARRCNARLYPAEGAFAAASAISIDHAVMEHAARIAVVPVEMGWSDVGSWDALHDIARADANGNVVIGDARAMESGNCLLRTDGPLLVALGVRDLVVVATGDIVMILPRGESQRVKEVVEALACEGGRTVG